MSDRAAAFGGGLTQASVCEGVLRRASRSQPQCESLGGGVIPPARFLPRDKRFGGRWGRMSGPQLKRIT